MIRRQILRYTPNQRTNHWLVAILYSREQLAKEGEVIAADWGIVGCLYTEQPEDLPMAPITMMRNALGVAEGGSGVALDREAYARSVAFWDANANWRQGGSEKPREPFSLQGPEHV